MHSGHCEPKHQRRTAGLPNHLRRIEFRFSPPGAHFFCAVSVCGLWWHRPPHKSPSINCLRRGRTCRRAGKLKRGPPISPLVYLSCEDAAAGAGAAGARFFSAMILRATSCTLNATAPRVSSGTLARTAWNLSGCQRRSARRTLSLRTFGGSSGRTKVTPDPIRGVSLPHGPLLSTVASAA